MQKTSWRVTFSPTTSTPGYVDIELFNRDHLSGIQGAEQPTLRPLVFTMHSGLWSQPFLFLPPLENKIAFILYAIYLCPWYTCALLFHETGGKRFSRGSSTSARNETFTIPIRSIFDLFLDVDKYVHLWTEFATRADVCILEPNSVK